MVAFVSLGIIFCFCFYLVLLATGRGSGARQILFHCFAFVPPVAWAGGVGLGIKYLPKMARGARIFDSSMMTTG
jgi:hypothetical protein